MDFYINLAISILLQVIRDSKANKKFYPALAKVYVKLQIAANMDQALVLEIEKQLEREGLK